MNSLNEEFQERIELKRLDEDWDRQPESPGVYIVLGDRALPRVGSLDERGILYVGMSKNLRSRLWKFWYAEHSASAFLWRHPRVASKLFDQPNLKTKKSIDDFLGLLGTRMASLNTVEDAERAERALLFAYLVRFGELPPLNAALPGRWDESPCEEDFAWANSIIETC